MVRPIGPLVPAAASSPSAGEHSGEVSIAVAPPAEEDYPKFVSVLQCEKPGIVGLDGQPALCEYHILGTAHVSRESCEDVRKVIRRVRPDVSPPTSSPLGQADRCVVEAPMQHGMYTPA